MAWQALYRKWRSRDLDEIVGQEHVTTTLRNALHADRVAHAYLFCGPRGTGKTSVARILAKSVNCLAPLEQRPCNECAICQSINAGRSLDLIEIDAASNRGIDEIRDLREKVHFSPSEMRKKFYIIDEVHMLTNEAFNALLKTLEEPPSHVIFCLATTEPHKIPATVLSRCQRFDFRRIPLQQITAHLETICEAEGFDIEPEALEFIGRAATGSLRDAISLLDQLAQAGETVTLDHARHILGAAGSESVGELVDHWLAGSVADGLRLLAQVSDEGADLRQFNRQVVEHLRGVLLLKATGETALLHVTTDVQTAMQAQAGRTGMPALMRAIQFFNEADRDLRANTRGEPLLPLELAFVQATLAPATAPVEPPTPSGDPPNEPATRPVPRPVVRPAPAQKRPASTAPATEPYPAPPASAPPPTGDLGIDRVRATWNQIISAMRGQSLKLQALLRSGEPAEVRGNTVVIAFPAVFFTEQLGTPPNTRLVEDVLSQELGRPCRVRFVLAQGSMPAPVTGDPDPVIQAAVDMGGRVRKD
ncbi:MAG: DNA polymerase III subunit gamma/tau [Chloroflexi bacterium]|nr:DNA polymerase III subunit gamma/tau [Chloroflexota bacterium]MBU1748421.1 DNA polymerase III subunit gamma/tau [Chloroflexota bacterium]